MPSQDADTLFEELLQDLPHDLHASAYEFKAFARARKITSPLQLLRVVLAYAGLDFSVREVAGQVTLLSGDPISDTAIAKRLQACGPWVKALLEKAFELPDLSAIGERVRVLVVDGSTVQAPGARGTHYRVHVCVDLARVRVVGVVVTDVHVGESLTLFDVRPGDWVLADRGYSKVPAIIAVHDTGAQLVVRLNHGAVVATHPDTTPIHWGAVLEDQQEQTIRTIPIVLATSGGKSQIRGVVHAYRLSEQQAEAARRAKRAKGRTPTKETMLLAGWVLVFTTLDAETVSGETILALYGCRWQVELVIKRWKSLLDLDLLRARYQGPLADVWLHGKLLYASMIERRAARRFGLTTSRIDGPRRQTWWRVWKLITHDVAPKISGAEFWRPEAFELALSRLAERPRRRLLQCVPLIACFLSTPPAPASSTPLP
jgi:hypothetical protein